MHMTGAATAVGSPEVCLKSLLHLACTAQELRLVLRAQRAAVTPLLLLCLSHPARLLLLLQPAVLKLHTGLVGVGGENAVMERERGRRESACCACARV